MKNKTLRLGAGLLALGSICAIFSCSLKVGFQGESDKFTIEKFKIFIPPTNISEEDRTAMSEVLAKFDKSLYRIQTYNQGKLMKEEGELSTKFLSQAVVEEVMHDATSASQSFTGSAIQAGRGPGGTHYHNPNVEDAETTGTRGPGGSHYHSANVANAATTDDSEAGAGERGPGGTHYRNQDRRLVRKLRPILEKYAASPKN